MVNCGWRRRNLEEGEYQFNSSILIMTCRTLSRPFTPLRNFKYAQHLKYIGHVCWAKIPYTPKVLLLNLIGNIFAICRSSILKYYNYLNSGEGVDTDKIGVRQFSS